MNAIIVYYCRCVDFSCAFYFLFLLLQPKHFQKYQTNERERDREMNKKITY